MLRYVFPVLFSFLVSSLACASTVSEDYWDNGQLTPFTSKTNICGDWVREGVSKEPPTPDYPNYTYEKDESVEQDYVIVGECGSISPAIVRFTFKVEGEMWWRVDSKGSLDTCECFNPNGPYDTSYPTRCWSMGGQIYGKAEFDDSVFVVNGQEKNPVCTVGGTVSLKNSNCETLRKAKGQKVTFSNEIYLKVISNSYTKKTGLGTDGDSASWTEYYAVNEDGYVREKIKKENPDEKPTVVGVKFIPGNLLDTLCSDAESPSPGNNASSSCSQCSGSSESQSSSSSASSRARAGASFSSGNAKANVSKTQSESVSARANLTSQGEVEITDRDYSYWFSPSLRTGYEVSDVSYEYANEDKTIISKMSFQVIDDQDKVNKYECSGNWNIYVDEFSKDYNLAWEAVRGAIPQEGTYEIRDGYELKEAGYEYNENGLISKYISYASYIYEPVDPNDPNDVAVAVNTPDGHYIEYTYDDNDSIERVDIVTPEETRSVYLDYGRYGKEGTLLLNGLSFGCDSCGGQWYEYKPKEASLQFTTDYNSSYEDLIASDDYVRYLDPNNYIPEGYLVTEVKNEEGEILEKFEYDSQDRFIAHYLGDCEEVVSRWDYSDNGRRLLRKDYINDIQYRAKEFIYSPGGHMEEERLYHELQNDGCPELLGQYSAIKYCSDSDESNSETSYTIMPEGNRSINEYTYNSYGYVLSQISKIADPNGAEIVTGETYFSQISGQSGGTKQVVNYSVNAYGGITDYKYDNSDFPSLPTQVTEIDPDNGGFGEGSQTVKYSYDKFGRLEDETHLDSNGDEVVTHYVYDRFGNLDYMTEGYGTDKALTTSYEYNGFNELVATHEPTGKITRKFYTESGGLKAEAVYISYTDLYNNEAVSATLYVYEDGYLKYKKVANENSTFTFSGQEDSINWIVEQYNYDEYGRKESVVADYGGDNLTTSYQYNSQSEIIKVTKPGGHYVETIYNGRGLVYQEVSGSVQGGEKHIVTYLYNENGDLVRKYLPNGESEISVYDSYGRFDKTIKIQKPE